MRAARVQDGRVQIVDIDDREPGHEEARVRLTASGVCHSDLHIARGDWTASRAGGPLGHEGIGVVEALGPNVEGWVEVGDRVIVGLGGACGHWCGACEYCLKGQPRHCTQSRPIMGTFAEKICVWAPSLVKLPDSITDEDAPLACGGLTAYGAVKKLLQHHVLPGRPVAVIGAAGGLGHYAVQLATAFGYRVVGVDIGKERLDFVRSLGAVAAVEPDEAAAVAAKEFGGCDAALVFSARIAGFQLGLKMLRKGGLWVGVGLPPTAEGNIEINPFEFFFLDPTMIYSATGTVQDMRELVELAAAGKVKTHVSRTGALSELPEIFDDLAAGRYLGRAVVTDLRS